MIRRLVGSFALAAVLATGAQAQTVNFTDPGFTLLGVAGGSQNGLFQIGSVNGVTGSLTNGFKSFGPGSAFRVWCVDETNSSVPVVTFPVTVTLLTSTGSVASYLHDANSSKAYTDYVKAAWLTTQMSGTNDPSNPSVNTAIQLAIWKIMGYTAYSASSFYNATDVNFWFGQANLSSNYNTINLADWAIITDNTGGSDGQGCAKSPFAGCNQEFIANVAPEPATMALMAMGLVGMAGAGIRRRKK